MKQGSSTARAPACAGGAGSSPAPVANLTDMVLAIVNEQLDEGYYGSTARAQPEEASKTAMEKQPDAVADVPDQNFKPASSDRQPVLEGDRHREAIRARNREALQRWERRMIIDKPTS